MSWFTGREEGSKEYDEFQMGPNTCFFCGKPLWMPRVVWHGGHSIALHTTCAVRLSQHCMKDALIAEAKFLKPDYVVDPRQYNELLSLRREVEHWKEQVLLGAASRRAAP